VPSILQPVDPNEQFKLRRLEARRRRHAVRAARREGSTVAAEGEEDEPVA